MTKKLIEVALPLEAINAASRHEKDVKVGKPTSVHHWWARRPLAAARAVLFASLVDDPSSRPEEFPTRDDQRAERERLFALMAELVQWKGSNDVDLIARARTEILNNATAPPEILDPFAGGGTIPLEAQRLGLATEAADLNPIAVLINRALVEYPALFIGREPVAPAPLVVEGSFQGTEGLASDIDYYGRWVRERVAQRIGLLYPPAVVDGTEYPVVAWLWARTIRCPNPACSGRAPLIRSFTLSTKAKRERHLRPLPDREAGVVRFEVRDGKTEAPGTVTKRGATCLLCSSSIPLDFVRSQGVEGQIGYQLIGLVADAPGGRLYLPPSAEHERVASSATYVNPPDEVLPDKALGFRVQAYGIRAHRDLYTSRQLGALLAFSSVVRSAYVQLIGDGADEIYATAVSTYLGFAVDRVADWGNTLSRWENKAQVPQQVFGMQTVSMTWDFSEANPLGKSTGSFAAAIANIARSLRALPVNRMPVIAGRALQRDATATSPDRPVVVCTDPPYYDNIGYADLSDLFYVWLRRSIGPCHPDLFSTLLTPKTPELIASPDRFDGDRQRSEQFFEEGLQAVFERLRAAQHPDYPLTVFYAFKQTEAKGDGDSGRATGWETFLASLLSAGYEITATWPIRTEMGSRRRGLDSNALASSIVLACRARRADAPLATRRDFLRALQAELPDALRTMQEGNIAPVDLAQAAIGPGMAVFSRYARVVEADGSPMSVRTALSLLNRELDEQIAHQEADFDGETRWAVSWFEQFGMNEGAYGVAETLCTARNVAMNGLKQAGIVAAPRGKVRLLERQELDPDWDPATDQRFTIWEVVQHLILELETEGEMAAAELIRRLGGVAESAKELAYRLYVICERKGWANEALAYNAIIVAWSELTVLSAGSAAPIQESMKL